MNILEKLLAYTRFVVMTRFGMNFVCIKETVLNYVKLRAKSAVYENVHLMVHSVIFMAKRVSAR